MSPDSAIWAVITPLDIARYPLDTTHPHRKVGSLQDCAMTGLSHSTAMCDPAVMRLEMVSTKPFLLATNAQSDKFAFLEVCVHVEVAGSQRHRQGDQAEQRLREKAYRDGHNL
jgi:hypothetical protein